MFYYLHLKDFFTDQLMLKLRFHAICEQFMPCTCGWKFQCSKRFCNIFELMLKNISKFIFLQIFFHFIIFQYVEKIFSDFFLQPFSIFKKLLQISATKMLFIHEHSDFPTTEKELFKV